MPEANGSEIRRRRRETGMKLSDLARKTGIKVKTLANAESLNQVISVEYAVRIAAALPDTRPEDLLLIDVTNGTAA
jgi:transcriptional regulator with XRE-family HTH domain